MPLHLAGAGCALGYGALAWLARQPGEPALAAFFVVVGYTALLTFGLYGWLTWRRGAVSIAGLLFWALAFRLCGLLGGPFYEDDFHRYLWDGYRFATDGTPYGAAPEAYFVAAGVPAAFERVLDQINNPHLATIYGPVTQLAFLAAYWAAPASVAALQALFIAVDLALVGFLLRLAPARNVLLYAWCPLVVKEIAFTAHPEGLGVALLVLAVAALGAKRFAAAAICLGLAAAAKVVALLAAPLLLARMPARYWPLAPGVLALAYLPFALQGGTDLATLAVFAREWRFNPSLFAGLAFALGDLPARLAAGAALAGLAGWLAWRRRAEPPRCDWLFGAWLALSPVVNPWYLLWLLPFAVVHPSRWAWTASAAVLLAYVTALQLGALDMQPYALPAWVPALEYGAIALALCVDAWRAGGRLSSGART